MSKTKRVSYRELGNWDVTTHLDLHDDGSHTADTQRLIMAVLFIIRDELRAMNQTLSVLKCPNFLAVPRTLKQISRNTHKKRKPRVVGKPKLRVVR